ncbi:hypothetical protein DFP72DRAFT_863873 [Ephemerocybe angulata]|uniref:Uncharacterized protein n=1 Tax=Ephemerocybe angulata TaxID=980116 RepID=A0A8H6LSD5_9AGAR|nr:hypothetical protein DFP72DRAFT_863873 [Tulosesus angulatus]
MANCKITPQVFYEMPTEAATKASCPVEKPGETERVGREVKVGGFYKTSGGEVVKIRSSARSGDTSQFCFLANVFNFPEGYTPDPDEGVMFTGPVYLPIQAVQEELNTYTTWSDDPTTDIQKWRWEGPDESQKRDWKFRMRGIALSYPKRGPGSHLVAFRDKEITGLTRDLNVDAKRCSSHSARRPKTPSLGGRYHDVPWTVNGGYVDTDISGLHVFRGNVGGFQAPFGTLSSLKTLAMENFDITNVMDFAVGMQNMEEGTWACPCCKCLLKETNQVPRVLREAGVLEVSEKDAEGSPDPDYQ